MEGFAVADQLAGDGSPPLVVLVSSRLANEYGARVARRGVLGFIAKEDLSGEAIRVLIDGV